MEDAEEMLKDLKNTRREADDAEFLASSIAPAVNNHLWQSTLFAAGLAVDPVLRRNAARVGYGYGWRPR